MMIAGTAAATGSAADALVQEDFNYLASVEYVLSLEEILTRLAGLAEQLCADTEEVAEAHGDVDAVTTSMGRTVVDHSGVRDPSETPAPPRGPGWERRSAAGSHLSTPPPRRLQEDLGAPGETGLGFALLQVGLVSRELGARLLTTWHLCPRNAGAPSGARRPRRLRRPRSLRSP